MVRLATRDVRAALDFVHAVSSTQSREPSAAPTLELLRNAIPADVLTYIECDISAGIPGPSTTSAEPAFTLPPDVADARREYCCTYPLSALAHSSDRGPLKISDFLTLRELRRTSYYASVLRPLGFDHELRVWLTAPAGTARLFSFVRLRGRRDFAERDRAMLDLLRPFLAGPRGYSGSAGRSSSAGPLSEREAEVLRWVARGKTNKEIAALLVVSPHTVRTHLEHAFDKLGVHTRAAAITAAFGRPG